MESPVYFTQESTSVTTSPEESSTTLSTSKIMESPVYLTQESTSVTTSPEESPTTCASSGSAELSPPQKRQRISGIPVTTLSSAHSSSSSEHGSLPPANGSSQSVHSSSSSAHSLSPAAQRSSDLALTEGEALLPSTSAAASQWVPGTGADEQVMSLKLSSAPKGTINHYRIVDFINSGSYGRVYKASHEKSKEVVAIKEITFRRKRDGTIPVSILREISYLTESNHPNIVKKFATGMIPGIQDVICILMEYMEYDLSSFMSVTDLSIPQVKKFMRDLLNGVDYLHQKDLMHRDLKPGNLLLDTDGQLKLADFGFVRMTLDEDDDTPLTPRVQTQWYRAPEILLSANRYNQAIDIWSIGCIMAELLSGAVLFKGHSEIDQFFKILELLGTPSHQDWPAFETLCGNLSIPTHTGKSLASTIRSSPLACEDISDAAFHLLGMFLRMDPEKRTTCRDALTHHWISQGAQKRKREES